MFGVYLVIIHKMFEQVISEGISVLNYLLYDNLFLKYVHQYLSPKNTNILENVFGTNLRNVQPYGQWPR